jgi:hypothetical protein
MQRDPASLLFRLPLAHQHLRLRFAGSLFQLVPLPVLPRIGAVFWSPASCRVAPSRAAAAADSVSRSDAVANSHSAACRLSSHSYSSSWPSAAALSRCKYSHSSTLTLAFRSGLSDGACVSRLGEGEGGLPFQDDTLCAGRVVLTAGGLSNPSSRTG